MNSGNCITVIGRPVRPVVLSTTKAGRSYARFKIIEDASYRGRGGDRVNKSCCYDVVVWGDSAERLNDVTLEAECTLIVVGRLEQRSFDTKYGDRRSVVEIVVEDWGVSAARPPEPLPADQDPF